MVWFCACDLALTLGMLLKPVAGRIESAETMTHHGCTSSCTSDRGWGDLRYVGTTVSAFHRRFGWDY